MTGTLLPTISHGMVNTSSQSIELGEEDLEYFSARRRGSRMVFLSQTRSGSPVHGHLMPYAATQTFRFVADGAEMTGH